MLFNDLSSSRFLLGSMAGIISVCVLLPLGSHAQPSPADTAKAPTTAITPLEKNPVTKPAIPGKPVWSDLTPLEQQALKPLAGTWTTISEAQKRKWLAVSKNYPTLSPDGQARVHGRMNEWVGLSAQQRAEARLNFATTKELSKQFTPEEKLAKWQTYQSLTSEEKQKLADQADGKPAGAALAVKPVAQKKLAPVQPHPATSLAPAGSKPQKALQKGEPSAPKGTD